MKFLATILALFILSLSALPCDDVSYNNQQSETISEIVNLDNHSHSDMCSPFCMCACCGQTFSSSFTYYSLALHVPVSVEKFPIYNASFVSEVYLSIWQPPKIS